MLALTQNEALAVSRAKAGDAAAWNCLLGRLRLPLYIYVLRLVRDEHAGFDIVQETFVSAVQHIGSLKEDERFGSWLFGIAHQKCLQLWRRQHREEEVFQEYAETPREPDEDPRQWLIRREQEQQFLELLDKLPAPQRSVLLLFFVEEFSLEEIAAITSVSPGTVKSRLHYAKKAFRELWKEKVQ
jgi:RNA polymerase sigma-70 factor, ECF subfamily